MKYTGAHYSGLVINFGMKVVCCETQILLFMQIRLRSRSRSKSLGSQVTIMIVKDYACD